MDIPADGSIDAELFVQSVANRLGFEVSAAQFPSDAGPPSRVWEIYGRGVSMFVPTAMKQGEPDLYGNRSNTFNPNRLNFNVVKTGWLQRADFEEVVEAAQGSAVDLGWPISEAPAGESCST